MTVAHSLTLRHLVDIGDRTSESSSVGKLKVCFLGCYLI
jgi:hypothetical protein